MIEFLKKWFKIFTQVTSWQLQIWLMLGKKSTDSTPNCNPHNEFYYTHYIVTYSNTWFFRPPLCMAVSWSYVRHLIIFCLPLYGVFRFAEFFIGIFFVCLFFDIVFSDYFMEQLRWIWSLDGLSSCTSHSDSLISLLKLFDGGLQYEVIRNFFSKAWTSKPY